MSLLQLNNAELLRQAYAEIDSLTSTPLELELLRRFEALVDGYGETASAMAEHGYKDRDAAAVLAKVNDFNLDANDIQRLGDALVLNASLSAELLTALIAAGIDSAEALTSRLQLADGFTSLASDAGDLFSRLSTLAETTQE